MMSRVLRSKIKEQLRLFSMQSTVLPMGKLCRDESVDVLSYNEIPGPKYFELIRRFMPSGKYHKISQTNLHKELRLEYGNLVKFPGLFGRKTFLISFDVNDIELILRTEGQFPNRKSMETLAYYRKTIRPDIYNLGGLTVEHGKEWQRMRSSANSILLQPKIIKNFVPIVDEISQDFIKLIKRKRDDKNEMPADFGDFLKSCFLEAINALTFGTRLGLLDESINNHDGTKTIKTVRKVFELIYEIECLPTFWRYYHTKSFKELLQGYQDLTDLILLNVEKAKTNFHEKNASKSQQDSLLGKFLEKDPEIATVMAVDSIISGIDTTSSSAIGVLYCLAKYPDKQELLRKEIMNILPDKNTPLTSENMKNMPYLRAVIKEGMRMYSPTIGNLRKISKNLVLQGYHVPKNVDVLMGLMELYKDENYFSDANEYLPERWLKRQETSTAVCPQSAKKSHPFSFLPFGHGARNCIGHLIAKLEMEVIITRIIQNYRMEWHHPEMKVKSGLINIPDSDLKFTMTDV